MGVGGLKESPRLWNKELHGWLSGQGFSQSKSDPCLYVNRDRTVYLCIYVDDILCVSHTDDASRAFVSEMRKRFVVTDCGMPKVFLGIQLAYDRARHVLRMCQTDLIDTLLKRYNLTPTHVSTPLDPDVRLTCHDDADTKPDATIFRSKVGTSLFFLRSRASLKSQMAGNSGAVHLWENLRLLSMSLVWSAWLRSCFIVRPGLRTTWR